MTRKSSSMRQSLSLVPRSLLISVVVIVLFPLTGPLLVASNRFRLAERFSFLPGINGAGGRLSGISTAIYIVSGFLLVGSSVMVATGSVPGFNGAGPTNGTDVVTPAATPTATPQAASDARLEEYEAFVQAVDGYSPRSPDSWAVVNETTLNMTVEADWTKPPEYNNENHPIPESVLHAMNGTENPPERVKIAFYNESGTWLRTVTVKEEWADPFVGYELGINAMHKRFGNTTNTKANISDAYTIPPFHLTFDDVRHAYAKGLREKLTNESWKPSEYNTSGRKEIVIGESGLYHSNITLQNDETIRKERVIYVNVLQSEENRGGHALGYVPSAFAELIDERYFGVRFGDPGLALRIQFKDPNTGRVWHDADVRSSWAQYYNVGQLDWAQYKKLVIFRG